MKPWNRGGATPMIEYRLAVDAQRTAKHSVVAIESRSPPTVADDRDRVIRRLRCSADGRRYAKVAEEVRRNLIDLPCWFHPAVNGDRGAVEASDANDLGHDLVQSANGIEGRPLKRGNGFSESAGHVRNELDLHEAVGRAHRQRAQQHTVDEAEERRVGADAEREGERDDSGERRALPEHSNGVAHVLREDVEHRQAVLLAVHFAKHVRPAEFLERLASSGRSG